MNNTDSPHYQVRLITGAGELKSGGLELLEEWRRDSGSRIWVDRQGLPDAEEVEFLDSFGFHELAVTDAHRQRHPPKVELFDDHIFMLFRGISEFGDKLDITHLQIALFVGDRYIITRHDSGSFGIDHWLNNPDLSEFLKTPSILAVQILHYSCGKYLEQLLAFEENLSDMEDLMENSSDDNMLRELTLYKTRLRKLRRVFDYHQKMVATLLNTRLWVPDNNNERKHYTQDLHDRCERLHSLSSMYYEICGDLIDGYLSLSSHRLNLTMRVLTVITAVFVPLSFIAGLYGMNFEYMPELKYHYAYFVILGVMLTTVTVLLTVFRRKRWL